MLLPSNEEGVVRGMTMPKTPRTQAIIGFVVLILAIGALSFSWILNVFAPAVITVEQGPARLEEHVADPPGKTDEKKMAARRSSENAEKPRPSETRSVANPLPHGSSPTSNASPAPYTALHNRVQVEELDPTLEEEGGALSEEEQYAQEQYLQEVAAMEEILQREFDPTAVPQELTAAEVMAMEEELQESILQEESLRQ
jgi:hypothetical protein